MRNTPLQAPWAMAEREGSQAPQPPAKAAKPAAKKTPKPKPKPAAPTPFTIPPQYIVHEEVEIPLDLLEFDRTATRGQIRRISAEHLTTVLGSMQRSPPTMPLQIIVVAADHTSMLLRMCAE